MAKRTNGLRFLRDMRRLEERCSRQTWKALPKTGKQAPRCLKALGELLSLTYRASSCYWGCAGPDHTLNHLAVRVAATASASLRCMAAGYYDESLALTRSVGELANLIILFSEVPDQFEEWRKAKRSERLDRFSPYKVRLALEQNAAYTPIDKDRYAALSESGVHATPAMVPGGHNPARRSVLGHIFQLPGAILATTELAIATAPAAHKLSRLLDLEADVRASFDEATRDLIEGLPGIDISNVGSTGISFRSRRRRGRLTRRCSRQAALIDFSVIGESVRTACS